MSLTRLKETVKKFQGVTLSLVAILGVVVLLSFQNCGKSGFRSVSAVARFHGSGSQNPPGNPATGPRDGDQDFWGTPSPSPTAAGNPSPSPAVRVSTAPPPSLAPQQQETTPGAIQGVWKTPCFYSSKARQYANETLTLTAGTMNTVTDFARSSTCAPVDQRVEYHGTYSIELTNTTGVYNSLKFGYHTQDYYETYWLDSYLQALNQQNVCGKSDWGAGDRVYVRGLSCAGPDGVERNGRIQKSGAGLRIDFSDGTYAVYFRVN